MVYREYGIYGKMKPKQSRDTMKAPWNPADGFETHRKRFDEVIIFVALIENSISTGDTLNLLFNSILKRGVFHIQYTEWYHLSDTVCTLVNALEWWGKKCRIQNKFTKLTGNMGDGTQYGMTGAQKGAVDDLQFKTWEEMTNKMDVNRQATKAATQQRDQAIHSQ